MTAPDAAAGGGESQLSKLVSGFADIEPPDMNMAIKELTKKGYRSMYDLTPDTIEKLKIPEGAKMAMKRQLLTAKADKVPTGEKQSIGVDEIAAMKAYVSEGIQRKDFSWEVPLPDSKPLIDTDDQSYTWNAPDISKWCASQVVEVVHATKLQYGLLSGVADPSKTLLRAAHPALCLKGADGWRDVVLQPDRTFEKSVAAFSGSTYTKAFERTSKRMSVEGKGSSFSVHVKDTLDSQKGSIGKNEEFSIVTKVSCYGCELNLANHLDIRPEVEQEFAAVFDDPKTNFFQKRAKINGLFEKYGAFYVRQCKLGVQATGTNTVASKFSFTAKDLASTLEAGCSLSLFAGAGAAKRGFSGSSELQETAKNVSERLNVEVIGATIAPGHNFLTEIARSAGDPRRWAVLDISEIVPIIDLFDPVLRKKVNDLDAQQPWCCGVVEKRSDGDTSVTIGAADIEKQLGKGYTVIGGGARAGLDLTEGKALFGRRNLTESRPTHDAENRTTGWRASHSEASLKAFNEVVTAYAICLKPNDSSIELVAKVATERTRGHSIELTQFQAQKQHPGYTLVSGGGMCVGKGGMTASSPTGNETTVDGWKVVSEAECTGETVVYGVMLKNVAGFQYRVKRHRSVYDKPPFLIGPRANPFLKLILYTPLFFPGGNVRPSYHSDSWPGDLPELSSTQLVCGGGVNVLYNGEQSFKQSAPIIDRITGALIGWAATSNWGKIEAYTVSFDTVASV